LETISKQGYKKLLYNWRSQYFTKDFPNKMPCYESFLSLVVAADGNTYPCCFLNDKVESVGKLKKQSLREIWNSRKIKRFRYTKEKSKECSSFCESYLNREIHSSAKYFVR